MEINVFLSFLKCNFSKNIANYILSNSIVYLLCLSGVHEGRFNYSTLRTSVPDMQPQPYVISDLHSYTQYKVTVQAFNSIGASPTSKEVTVTTHQAREL